MREANERKSMRERGEKRERDMREANERESERGDE